jgi:hypothetical protein
VLFRRMGAETAHRLGFGLIRAAAEVPGLPWLLRRWLAPADPVLRVRALGRDLPGPLGLAANDDIDAIADLAVELRLDGIIATNTTVSRDHLASDPAEVQVAGAGGLSGAPLRQRSLQVLRRLRARTGDRLLLVASGGIETPDDAWERIQAGATLLQAYPP